MAGLSGNCFSKGIFCFCHLHFGPVALQLKSLILISNVKLRFQLHLSESWCLDLILGVVVTADTETEYLATLSRGTRDKPSGE